jgi:hypothetical protein
LSCEGIFILIALLGWANLSHRYLWVTLNFLLVISRSPTLSNILLYWRRYLWSILWYDYIRILTTYYIHIRHAKGIWKNMPVNKNEQILKLMKIRIDVTWPGKRMSWVILIRFCNNKQYLILYDLTNNPISSLITLFV